MFDRSNKFIYTMLIFTMSIFLIGCSAFSEEDSDNTDSFSDSSEITMEDVMEQEAAEDEDYDNGIIFEEEDDGAELVLKKSSPEDFVGSWEATSGQAMYQFGNVDIKVRLDGTWSGNIADEDLKGSWKQYGDGIYCSSDLFEFTLAYTQNNVLIMRTVPEEDNPEDVIITTVLTKK